MTSTRLYKIALFASAMSIASLGHIYSAAAITLREAIGVAVESNPQISQAAQNREATEFEVRQAKGLFLPSIDLESSVGADLLNNATRRSLGEDDDTLAPAQVGVTITQKLFDGGNRRAELRRQAARVDGASFRVLERSEYIALQVAKSYIEYLLQARIVQVSEQNMSFHRKILGDISASISGGALTEADRQQAQERLLGATARSKQAREDLEASKIDFFRLVGKPLVAPSLPPSMSGAIPKTLDVAIDLARRNNPQIHMARADVDAADALVDKARANYSPEIDLEGSARAGHDVDGVDGRTTELGARIVAKWNLYRGGIDSANEQEQIRRASEERYALHEVYREVEDAVRTSWNRRVMQLDLEQTLRSQAAADDRLVSSYRQQFRVGQRSLLDVLDAQNTRVNTDILAMTSQYAVIFANYRLLAATGKLLSTLNLKPAPQSAAYARKEFNVPATAATDTYARTPSHQTNDLPFDLLAPVRNN
jgi:adhesin transport system outer membrane protein